MTKQERNEVAEKDKKYIEPLHNWWSAEELSDAYNRLLKERDDWKSRAEALENCIREYVHLCDCCENSCSISDEIECSKNDYGNWSFDFNKF